MKPSHLVKDLGGLALYGLGPETLGAMSRGAMVRLSRALGQALRAVSAEDVALMKEELEATFDTANLPDSVDKLIEDSFALRMFDQLEVLSYPSLQSRMGEVAMIEGREHLDAALARGKGAIVMIGHFGANLMIMPTLGYAGFPMNQLSAPPTAWTGIRTDGRANPLWQKVQERRWELEQTLPAQHIDVFGFLRPAYRCLAENQVLGLAFDGGGGKRWLTVELGERKARVPTQPWQLARSTGAAVLPTVVLRHPGERMHRVVIAPEIEVAKTSDRDADLQSAADEYAKFFTRWLKKRPSHYLHYLLLRRRVRLTDAEPFFLDYPEGRP